MHPTNSLPASVTAGLHRRTSIVLAVALLGTAGATSPVRAGLGRAHEVEAAALTVPRIELVERHAATASREPVPVAVAAVDHLFATYALSLQPFESADSNSDGVHDTWTYDDDGDGWIDRLVMDRNQDGWLDLSANIIAGTVSTLTVDSDMNGYYDAVVVPHATYGSQTAVSLFQDLDENGRYEHGYFDGQLDGTFEWIQVDTNADGSADTWVANTTPAGRTAADEAARQVAAIGAFTTLQAGGVPIFGPLAWPVGG